MPFDVLHHQVIRTDVVKRTNMRVTEGGDDAGLADEAVAELAGHRLDGHAPSESRVARLVHLTHAARSDRLDDRVRTERGVRRQHGLAILLALTPWWR